MHLRPASQMGIAVSRSHGGSLSRAFEMNAAGPCFLCAFNLKATVMIHLVEGETRVRRPWSGLPGGITIAIRPVLNPRMPYSHDRKPKLFLNAS